jgi:hypothetical protein
MDAMSAVSRLMKPEGALVRRLRKAAAVEGFQQTLGGRGGQGEDAPGFRGGAARGFDQLDEAEVDGRSGVDPRSDVGMGIESGGKLGVSIRNGTNGELAGELNDNGL